MPTPPKRDARTLLFTGGLLLVPLAAVWLLLNPAHDSRHGGGPGAGDARMGGPAEGETPAPPGPPDTPAWPPPRLASGAARQADWTLLALTVPTRSGFETPPAPLAPPAGGEEPTTVARNPFLQASAGAVGLWIGVRGGVGVKTLAIPQDGRRHDYPFGRFTLVAQPQTTPPTGPGAGGFSGSLGGGFGGVIISSRAAGISTLQWTTTRAAPPPEGGPGRVSRSQPPHSDDQVPYQIVSANTPQPAQVQSGPALVTLTPTPFSAGFRVTATPLGADGRPTGKAVALLCQPVTADALFTQIPAGYDAATRQFRVTVARASGHGTAGQGDGGGASWVITRLPPAAEDTRLETPAQREADADGQDPTPANAATVGPFTLRAVAAEAEDTGGRQDEANPQSGSGLAPANEDGHQRTGLPTLRFLLFARAASPAPPGQTWLFQLDHAAPQWGVPSPPAAPRQTGPSGVASAGGRNGGAAGVRPDARIGLGSPAFGTPFPGMPNAGEPLGVFPLSRPPSETDPAGTHSAEWLLRDGAVGGAWPGQQHRLTLTGSVIRQAARTETVTFHNAEVVHDAAFGGDRIVWRHSETETTPSGITVTVLNGTPGRRETIAPASGGSFHPEQGGGYYAGSDARRDREGWWYDRGNAELLLAWRLPPGFQAAESAPLNAPRVASPARWAGGRPQPGVLTLSLDDTRPDPYVGAVAPPSGRDARVLARAGYTPLRLSVWAAQTPKRTPAPLPPVQSAPLPPYSWRDGPSVVTATPLPRRLAALTFRITIREEQDRRPVRLVVPVSAALPPGADPRPALRLGTPARLPPPPPVRRRRGLGGRIGGFSFPM